MSYDTIIGILLFLSINVVIYVALLRWASRINDIEDNLERINAKLDLLTETILKSQDHNACDKDLH